MNPKVQAILNARNKKKNSFKQVLDKFIRKFQWGLLKFMQIYPPAKTMQTAGSWQGISLYPPTTGLFLYFFPRCSVLDLHHKPGIKLDVSALNQGGSSYVLIGATRPWEQ